MDDVSRFSAGIPAVAERVAREMLESLVEDLKLRPGDFAYERSLRTAFEARGLAVEDIRAGLRYATQQGWVILDPAQRIYTLTRAGFEIG